MNTIQILCTMRIVLAIEKIIFYKHFQQPFFRTGTGDGVQNSFNILMTTKASQNSQKLTQFSGRKRSRLNLLAALALHCERLQQCREEQPLLTTSQLLILLGENHSCSASNCIPFDNFYFRSEPLLLL